ncbi:tetratricopeptide repeat protein [Thalassotalea euphylliae]|uniref:Tetratricopeptide repeat protein n=1 Tax=Thalassotalea euphylliae TaxID=1655234 RepID=A0A3E0U0G3_9GAMM|nr:tetratricopeptide repeat protein [Thalassotalea euphylliae]REL30224.1 tetratricopeptide repeat protein [Thalassotalea euphylliae]
MKRSLLIISALLLIVIVYFPGLSADFYLDDFSSIVNNSTIKPPVDWRVIAETYSLRTIPYILFAIQYENFLDNTFGYHLISLIIHCANALLIFFVLSLTLRISQQKEVVLSTQPLNESPSLIKTQIASSAAALASLIYAIHPQNSQAVIYIVQQIALLAAFFSFVSIYAFLKLRTSYRKKHYVLWGSALLLSFICAMLSKQNTVVLPIIWLMLEYFVIKRRAIELTRVSLLLGFTLVIAISAYLGGIDEFIAVIDKFTRENQELSRYEYVLTQLEVLAHYISQFYILHDFRLEYDTAIAVEFGNKQILFLLLHSFFIVLAFLLVKRKPILSLAVLSFYVLHLVESSFIPIRDVAFEHRTYLPNFAHALLISSIAYELLVKTKLRASVLAVASIVVIFLSLLTNERAKLWSDKFAFYEYEISISKRNPRLYMSMGQMYIDNNQCHLAVSYFDHAIKLYDMAHESNLGKQPELFQSYAKCLFSLGLRQNAFSLLNKLEQEALNPTQKAMVLGQKAKMLMELKRHKHAKQLLVKAYQLDDKNIYILVNLAICEAVLKNFKAAKFLLESALVINPEHEMAIDLLKKVSRVIQRSVNRKEEARQ